MAADSRVIFSTELDDSGMRRGLDSLGGTIKKLAYGAAGVIALKAVGSALLNVAKSAMTYNSQMEQYYTSFSTLLGSEKAAAEKIAYLKEFAASTPFELTDLAIAQKTLLGFSVTSDKTNTVMKQLGDISQGNSERFSQLSLVYGQVSSTGKLMGQDLLQMINAGFNPLTIIAQKTGASVGDLKAVMAGEKQSATFKAQIKAAQDEVAKLGDGASDSAKMLAQIGTEGQISASIVDAAMESATSSGGLYYQAMEKQSKTAAGLISTVKDNANALGGEVFSSLSEAAKGDALPAALGYIDTLTTALRQNGVTGMMEAFGGIMGDIAGKASSFAPQLSTMAVNIIKSFALGIKKNASTIAKGLADAIKAAAMGLVSVLPMLLDTAISIALELVSGLADAMPDMMPTLVDSIIEALVSLLSNVPRLIVVGTKMAAAILAGVYNGLSTLTDGIVGLFADTLHDKVEKSVSSVKASINPKVSDEDQKKITSSIQSGYDAAKVKIQLQDDADTAAQGVVDKIEAAFSDGKLTGKEGNALGKDLNAYIDEAKGIAEDYVTSGGANSSIVEGLTASLDETYASYDELVKKITAPGYKASAEEIAQLEQLVQKLLGLKEQIQGATSDVLLLQQAKVRKVKSGTGSSEDFGASVGYEADMYQDSVTKAQKKLDDATVQWEAATQQADTDLASGAITKQQYNAALETIADEQSASLDEYTQTLQLASDNYNAEVASLYEGMAKANPEAAAALKNASDIRDYYIALNGLYSAIADMDENASPEDIQSATSKIQALYTDIFGTPLTSEQLAGLKSDFSLMSSDVLTQMDAALASKSSTLQEDPAMTNNPLVGYLQTLLDTGSFDALDVTTVSGSLSNALKTADFLTDMQGVGAYAVDGITAGIGTKAGSITAENMAVVRDAYIGKLKKAFGINSPAETTKPLGKYLVEGITSGMGDSTIELETAGSSIVGSISDGMDKNNAAKTSMKTSVTNAISAGKLKAYSGGYSIGSNIMSGIKSGLVGMTASLNQTMKTIVASLLQAAKDAAGVKSPSTLFRDQLGKYLAQGIGVGFTGTMNGDVIPSIVSSIGDTVKASQAALDNTLLAKVQRITGLELPSVSSLTNAIMRGSAISQTAGPANTSASTTTVDARQYITFEQPMQAPDEITRAMRRQNTYGLAGARA